MSDITYLVTGATASHAVSAMRQSGRAVRTLVYRDDARAGGHAENSCRPTEPQNLSLEEIAAIFSHVSRAAA